MMSLSSPMSGRKMHLVPTHIRTPEILITLAGVSLSVRQFLLILVGVSLSYRVFLTLSILSQFTAGQILRWVLAAFPLCVTLAFAFVSLAARSLEVWCVVAVRYCLRQRRFVWRSIRFYESGFLNETTQEDDNYGLSNPS